VLTLYDSRVSTNAIKVRFLLAELGLEYEAIEVPLYPKPAWYADIHPFDLIPTLIDGDFKVTESNTALRYLADREGRDDLYPREAERRARIDMLLDSLSLQVRPALWAAEEPELYGRPHSLDWRPDLDAALGGFEWLLADDGYATGDFSIADCAIAGRMQDIRKLPVDLTRVPRLDRVLELTMARPAYQASI
jgi:glutathione S-transferase